MIEITLPRIGENVTSQIRESFEKSKNGLIVVSSNDRNWNDYMVNVVISELRNGISSLEDWHEKIVLVNEDEKEMFPWLKLTDFADAESADIVYVGNIRSPELTKDTFELAKKTKVIGYALTYTAADFISRAQEFGATKEDIDTNLIAVIQQERDIA